MSTYIKLDNICVYIYINLHTAVNKNLNLGYLDISKYTHINILGEWPLFEINPV